MVKTACVIHYWGERFKDLGLCAKKSFKKFHPDVELFHIHDKNEHLFNCLKKHVQKEGMVSAGKRLLVAQELMEERGYEKVIILGADTITCSYLHEFMNPGADIVATFDYDYPLFTPRFTSAFTGEQPHLNADVVCFNSVKPIKEIINLLDSGKYPEVNYGEQGALNEVFYSDNGITGGWAEIPPTLSFYFEDLTQMAENSPLCCYNVRAKSTLFRDVRDEYGNRHFEYVKVLCESDHKPWKKFTELYKVVDNMLFTGDGRRIKVWHYCEGFGSGSDERMQEVLSMWKNEFFNEVTKKFFREDCDCEFFFPEGE